MIVIEPVRTPTAEGAKLTLSVHVPLAARLKPGVQVLLTSVNSVPLKAVAPSTNTAVPVLVTVITCAVAFVPTVVDTKVSAVLDNVAADAQAVTTTPVPASEIVLGAGDAL